MSENKPVLIELDADETPNVSNAPQVPDVVTASDGQTMQHVVHLAARRPSLLARLFWGSLTSVVLAVISVSAWNFATGLIAQSPALGMVVAGLFGLFLLICLVIIFCELLAFSRLRRVDGLHRDATSALADNNLTEARRVAHRLISLYQARPDTAWGRERLKERLPDAFDAASVLSLVEQDLLASLDREAEKEVEKAARQVATVTALVPLAMADVVAALTANIRMIRRIAEIYAGRSGTLGSWRLTRAVMAHLVATGAVAVGDDLIGSVAGGSLLGKVSRRFGEGVVNGALTARVGVAAMEVCRPLAFGADKKPSVSGLVKRALTGLFSS